MITLIGNMFIFCCGMAAAVGLLSVPMTLVRAILK